jgi:hypothetical protein
LAGNTGTMIKITEEFLTRNKFNKMNVNDTSYIRCHDGPLQIIDIIVTLSDGEVNVFINAIAIEDIDAIKLNQIWVLLTGRKENWFNHVIPCSLCGALPDKFERPYTRDDTYFARHVIKCNTCSSEVIGVDEGIALLSWNLSQMGVFND